MGMQIFLKTTYDILLAFTTDQSNLLITCLSFFYIKS